MAGDNADTQFPVEGHDGVEFAPLGEAEGNIESIRQPRKYNFAWSGHMDRIRL